MNMSEIGREFAKGVADGLRKPHQDDYDSPEPDWTDDDIPDDESEEDVHVEVINE